MCEPRCITEYHHPTHLDKVSECLPIQFKQPRRPSVTIFLTLHQHTFLFSYTSWGGGGEGGQYCARCGKHLVILSRDNLPSPLCLTYVRTHIVFYCYKLLMHTTCTVQDIPHYDIDYNCIYTCVPLSVN